MGSGSTNGHIDLVCLCHGRQKMAEITPGLGIEVISRHHGVYHVGSISVHDVLVQLSGTTDGSAILHFVQEQVKNN